MGKKNISRRDFINAMGVGTAALSLNAVLGACSPVSGGQTGGFNGEPDVELAMQAVPGSVQILDGSKTNVWRYTGEVLKGAADALTEIPGAYLGPIIKARSGQTVRVRFRNALPEPTIIHWHGLHVPESADGHPQLAIDPGETYIYDFKVMDRAGLYWYHPHPHGRTGAQVYNGLAGLFIVNDAEEDALNLPAGSDVPIVIQDRTFDGDNQLLYNLDAFRMTGFFGERVLVNGRPDYVFSAGTRPYRLRILNGSNARVYALQWSDNSHMRVIGTDGGLLERPVERDFIVLSPGERRDVWVDLSGYAVGSELILLDKNPMRADDNGVEILTIKIDHSDELRFSLSERLSTLQLHNEEMAINGENPRSFVLSMGMGMQWLINGKTFEMTKVDKNEKVKLGDTEVWEFTNEPHHMMGNLYHPMHIHGLQFQILERAYTPQYRSENLAIHAGQVDEGWHDTVLVLPGERVRVLMKFEDYAGLYLYHCHTLEHEDMGMMRNYRVSV